MSDPDPTLSIARKMRDDMEASRRAAADRVTAFELKQKSWARANWKPLAIGAGLVLLCVVIVLVASHG